ncbi:hypothetical protein [Saccharopolyspora phatthalungensis]|uniref:Uncharacterized protein n=1 Tax=Saccharopolyspora phatthalungensis TaxID=664693 RepID=A0A840Q623_9PSEU|nr:hypothetical protein [Saccharopolyspora phatthalungensis]MBB5155916.1 hypothetical protein [Saccharopolyspora phatthalungensis]
MNPTIIDETIGGDNNTYLYAQTVRTPSGRTVRAKVKRNSYRHQSSAVAHVLADDMTWTDLAFEPPENWWEKTPSPSNPRLDIVAELAPLVEKLIDQALMIIGDLPQTAER